MQLLPEGPSICSALDRRAKGHQTAERGRCSEIVDADLIVLPDKIKARSDRPTSQSTWSQGHSV